jgi:hypothetical protein
MPLRSYADFAGAFPHAHLVVARVGRRSAKLKPAKELLTKLLEVLELGGDYALGETEDEHDFAVRCLFARKDDADRVSEALYARPASGYPGHASQRAFRLDKEAQEIIKIIVMDPD